MAGYQGIFDEPRSYGQDPKAVYNQRLLSVNDDGRGYEIDNFMDSDRGIQPAASEHLNSQERTGLRCAERNMCTENELGQFGHQGYSRNHFSDDVERVSTRTKNYSACLMTVSASRNEMPNHPSYHGILDSKEAEQRLTAATESGCNSYLTRYSQTYESYVLSVVIWNNGTRLPAHFQLSINNDEGYFSIEGSQKPFRTLNELLGYYEKNPATAIVRSIGSVCLVPGEYHQRAPPQITGRLKHTSFTSQSNSEISMDEQQQLSNQGSSYDLIKEMEKQRQLFKEEMKQEREKLKDEISGMPKQRSAASLSVCEQNGEERHQLNDLTLTIGFIKEMKKERQLFKEEMEEERQKLKDLLQDTNKDQNKQNEVPSQAQAPQPQQQEKPVEEKKKCIIL